MLSVRSKNLKIIRRSMLYLNIIAVMFNSSLFLLITKYIVGHQLSYSLLESLQRIPFSPQIIFLVSTILMILLVTVIYFNEESVKNYDQSLDVMTILELAIMLLLLYTLQGSYNGIVLLVFMDIIFYARVNKHWFLFLAGGFALLMLSDFELLSLLVDITSINAYISFLPYYIRIIISFLRIFISSFNMVLFIIFLVSYLLEVLKEQVEMKQELDMILQVNDELKSYAALTEKIAEDRERKRIAREIHDTLGHALTGIAAGVDACIVLIDIDKERTKQQLQIVSSVVREGIKDVRRSLNKLRPGALENRTLKDAIEKMINEYKEVSHLNIELYYEWDKVDIDNSKEDIIFRLLQESITNSLRHGHAKNVEINMFNTESEYYITIQDDGIGCEEIHYGYGLKQMRERLAMIGGKVKYYNENGFRTTVEIPKVKGEEEYD